MKIFLEEGRIEGEKESVLPSVGEERIGGDNCFFLDNCLVIIRNIVCSSSKQINVIFSRFEFVKSFFESPFDSRLIRLYQVSH